MIVVTDDVAVVNKKEDNVSSSPSSAHAADESTTSTWDSEHDLAGKDVFQSSLFHAPIVNCLSGLL